MDNDNDMHAHGMQGQIGVTVDLQDTTNPPLTAKPAKLDAALGITEDLQHEIDEDDWDDVYGDDNEPVVEKEAPTDTLMGNTSPAPNCDGPAGTASTLITACMTPTAPTPVLPSLTAGENQHDNASTTGTTTDTRAQTHDGVPPVAIAQDNDLVTAPTAIGEHQHDLSSNTDHNTTTRAQAKDGVPPEAIAEEDDFVAPPPKCPADPEFMAAAAVQKKDESAEWQYDSSDGESSSDSDSSDSSSDSSGESGSGSDGNYELLDPETAARLLMQGDGDDNAGDKSKTNNTEKHLPRTYNEVKHHVVAKPDIEITQDMKITFLGTIEHVVENTIVIKGATSGEYQVLEGGSAVCREDRELLGEIFETFGSPQQPYYTVAFCNGPEIANLGLKSETKIYYVDRHSTFAFTQAMRNAKGTDASNIHDEEVAEEDQEFSDDEVEQEYKRAKKHAKSQGRGHLTRQSFYAGPRNRKLPGFDEDPFYQPGDAPPRGNLPYDDEPEEFYQPLRRPDNLSQMMADGRPPMPPQTSTFGRGNGGGRGRGRGRGGGGRYGGKLRLDRHRAPAHVEQGVYGRGGFGEQPRRGMGGDNAGYHPFSSNSGYPPGPPPANAGYPGYPRPSNGSRPGSRDSSFAPQGRPGSSGGQQGYQPFPQQPQAAPFNGPTLPTRAVPVRYPNQYPMVPFGYGPYGQTAQPQYGLPMPQTAPGYPQMGAYINPGFFPQPGQQPQGFGGYGQQPGQQQPPSGGYGQQQGQPPQADDLAGLLNSLQQNNQRK